jgi:RNA ligase
MEIIYPENRIVVNYGELQDLILLGVVETKTGTELPLEGWGLPVVKRYDGIKDIEQLRLIQEENREGFVIKFASGLRVKLKFEEYVRLHRILTGVNSRVIWDALRNNLSLDEYLEQVPDEFYDWVKATSAELKEEFARIEALCQAEFKHFEDRKEAALYYQSATTYPAVMFKMLDGRPYDHIIWKFLEPEYQKPFSLSDEA